MRAWWVTRAATSRWCDVLDRPVARQYVRPAWLVGSEASVPAWGVVHLEGRPTNDRKPSGPGIALGEGIERMRNATVVTLLELCLAGSAAQAATITLRWTGVVNGVYDPVGVFGGKIQNGDRCVADFAFDAAAPDLIPDDARRGAYRGLSATIQLGSVAFTGLDDATDLLIVNDASGDALTLSCQVAGSPDIGLAYLEARLMDWGALAFAGDALILPGTLPPLSAFQEVFFRGSGPGGMSKFAGSIDSLEITPESSALWPLLLGATMAWRRCRPVFVGAPMKH